MIYQIFYRRRDSRDGWRNGSVYKRKDDAIRHARNTRHTKPDLEFKINRFRTARDEWGILEWLCGDDDYEATLR